MNETRDSIFDPVDGPVSGPAAEPRKESGWDFSAESGKKPLWLHPSEPEKKPDWINHTQPARPEVSSRDAYRATHYSEDLDPGFITAERPSKRKALLIALGCLLLALLAAGGWWVLTHLRRDPLAELKLAASRSLDSYLDYVEELPNLHKYTENLMAFYGSDNKHVDLDVTTEGVAQSPDLTFQLSMDRDGKAKKSLLHASYAADGTLIPVDIYLDKKELQLSSSTLLTGEVLALPTKDFGKKWNASALAQSANTKLPEDFSLSFLTEGVSSESIKDTFGNDWTTFLDSVSYRKATEADGDSFFTGTGDIYVLTWDQAPLTQMGMKAENMLRSPNGNSQMNQYFPAMAVGMLYSMSKGIEAPKFLVSDGMLLGVSFREKTEQADYGIVRIELVGENNPWSRCVIDVCKWDSASQKLAIENTVECVLSIADGELRTTAVKHTADGNSSVVFESVYNDADGSLRVAGEMDSVSLTLGSSALSGLDVPELANSFQDGFTLRYVPTEDGVRMEGSIDVGKMSGKSALPVEGKLNLTVGLSTKTEPIQALSQFPTQVLDLDRMSLASLLMRLVSQLSSETSFSFN